MQKLAATIVGHQGADGYAPGNTLLSFQKAIELGCQRAELDVRLSKDGEIVVVHDAEIDGHVIANLTLTELKGLVIAEGQRIPTLQEVIDVCKGKIDLQIELKAPGTPEKVHELVTKNDIASEVVISSFDIERLRDIKKLNARLPVIYLFSHEPEDLWGVQAHVPLEYIGPRSTAVTPEMVKHAHDVGAKVYAFRVNDEKTGRDLIEMGVDDIGTSFPKLFLKHSTEQLPEHIRLRDREDIADKGPRFR